MPKQGYLTEETNKKEELSFDLSRRRDLIGPRIKTNVSVTQNAKNHVVNGTYNLRTVPILATRTENHNFFFINSKTQERSRTSDVLWNLSVS